MWAVKRQTLSVQILLYCRIYVLLCLIWRRHLVNVRITRSSAMPWSIHIRIDATVWFWFARTCTAYLHIHHQVGLPRKRNVAQFSSCWRHVDWFSFNQQRTNKSKIDNRKLMWRLDCGCRRTSVWSRSHASNGKSAAGRVDRRFKHRKHPESFIIWFLSFAHKSSSVGCFFVWICSCSRKYRK